MLSQKSFSESHIFLLILLFGRFQALFFIQIPGKKAPLIVLQVRRPAFE